MGSQEKCIWYFVKRTIITLLRGWWTFGDFLVLCKIQILIIHIHTALHHTSTPVFPPEYTLAVDHMKASSVIFGAVVVFLAMLATADADSASENVSRQLKKGGRGKKKGDKDKEGGCADPAGAVVGLLACLAAEDPECAAAAYAPGFLRIHNERDTVPLQGM